MNRNNPTRLTKVFRDLRPTRVAGQAVCAALLMTLIPVGASADYEGYIGVFADPGGTDCNNPTGVPGL